MYMIRIIFGSVFPLLIFTGYSKALEKKNPSGKEKGVYKEVKWMAHTEKFQRNGPKILLWVHLGLV